MINDWQSTKTYSTLDNLHKALVKLGLNNVNCTLIVKTPDTNRYTAIFGKSFLDMAGINFFFVANAGFKVLG